MTTKKSTRFQLFIPLGILLLLVLFFLSEAGLKFIHAVSPEDTDLFIRINMANSPFWDPIMYAASSKLFWIPFYLLIVYCLYRAYGKRFWQALVTIALLIASADQISSGLIKNSVKRLRPSHEQDLISLVHLSKAGSGGLYGFVSSHAANVVALAVFLILLLDKSYRPLKIALVIWAFFVSYSRIYNGVHYPLDICAGGIIGALLGWIYYLLYHMVFLQKQKR